MYIFTLTPLFVGLVCASPLAQQNDDPNAPRDRVPIYRVTVERRAIQAMNYGHRTGPTNIDFRGTALLPRAKGQAKIESKSGAIQTDASFENLDPPTQFGREYLTYVLWAITPDGRPVNLGEIVADGGNKATLKTTTPLQAFGLIVTAEPYFAVVQPSNIVVLENLPRSDTNGTVEQVEAKYELLPRSAYSTLKPVEIQQPASNGAKAVPINQYEAALALYQAQNALQIARAEGAGQYAADTLQKAEGLYRNAEKLSKGDSKRIVSMAREATQTAADARTITLKRKQIATAGKEQ